MLGVELNPGPFSIKEHVLIGVLAQSGNGAAYASDILAVLSLYFKRELHAVAGITLLLTTQLIGFGLVRSAVAGLLARNDQGLTLGRFLSPPVAERAPPGSTRQAARASYYSCSERRSRVPALTMPRPHLQAMIWPNSLVTCNMYQTLHGRSGDQGNLRFFIMVFA